MESGSRRRRRRRCKIKMHWPTHILFGVCFHAHASARIHCVTCVLVADDKARKEELVLQAAVLRPALDLDISSASQ
jgi:hypothetical protein